VKRTRKLSCKNKAKYNSSQDADKAMKDFYRRNFGGIETNTSVYPCGNHYHWGHQRGHKR
jgi:hypothetical protein